MQGSDTKSEDQINESVEEYLAAIEDALEKEWEFWEKLDRENS